MMRHPVNKRMPTLLFVFLIGISALLVPLAIAGLADAEDQAYVCNQIPAQECLALEALYDGTNGDSWVDNTGWLVSDEPCSWFGVTCDDSKSNVNRLAFTANGLDGTIPEDLRFLTELIWLDLGGNDLRGEIPSELGSLSELRTLYLAGNTLSGTIPAQLGNLSNLELLYLNRNQLSGSIPSELGNLIALQFLYLDGSLLDGAVPDSLCSIDSLVNVSFGYNKLNDAESDGCVEIIDENWADTQTVPPVRVQAFIPQNASADKYAITVGWQPISYAEGGGYYEIYTATISGGPYKMSGRTADKTESFYTVTNLEAGSPHYFVVRTVTHANSKNKNELVSKDSIEVSGVPTALTLFNFEVAAPKPIWSLSITIALLLLSVAYIWSVIRKAKKG